MTLIYHLTSRKATIEFLFLQYLALKEPCPPSNLHNRQILFLQTTGFVELTYNLILNNIFYFYYRDGRYECMKDPLLFTNVSEILLQIRGLADAALELSESRRLKALSSADDALSLSGS